MGRSRCTCTGTGKCEMGFSKHSRWLKMAPEVLFHGYPSPRSSRSRQRASFQRQFSYCDHWADLGTYKVKEPIVRFSRSHNIQ